jgi:hypothetical protein
MDEKGMGLANLELRVDAQVIFFSIALSTFVKT